MKFLISLITFTSFILMSSCQTASQYKIQSSVKKFKMQNGVEVIYLRDASMPVFELHLWTPYGYAYEPETDLGVTYLMAENMVEGNKSLKNKFSKIGAEQHFAVGDDFLTFSAKSSTEDSLKLVKLFTQYIKSPVFDNKEILNTKQRMLAVLTKLKDNAPILAQEGFFKVVLGDHGYARNMYGTLDNVTKIRKKAVTERYEQIKNPQKMKLVLVGNWTEDAEANLLGEISDIEDPVVKDETIRSLVPENQAQNIFYNKPGLSQANILMGLTSIPRSSPEYVALKVGLSALGGDFTSRLNQKLRVEKGLTYGVTADIEARLDGGVIMISGAADHKKITDFISDARKVISETAAGGITQEELDKVKTFYSGQYPKVAETKAKEAQGYLNTISKGVDGANFYTFLSEVMDLNLNQVNDALRKYVYMPRLSVVVLGDKGKVSRKALKNFEVESIRGLL